MFMKMVRLSSLLATFVLVTFAFCFEFPALAGSVGQNSNSSTTTVENTNTAAPSARRGRRSRRRPPATTPATPAAATADSTAMPEAQNPTSQQPAATTEQTDLSGTYAGTFDCGDAGVTGETTLTITGNQFTTSDGKNGRITAATTQGYTGVAMQFGESTAATATTPATVPTIVSMRAKKAGDRLTLTSVPGSGKVCSFTPAGSSRLTRARKTTRAATPAQPATVPAAVGEPVTAPAAPTPVTPPPATAAPPATPAADPVTPGAEAGPAPPTAPSPGKRAKKKPGGTAN